MTASEQQAGLVGLLTSDEQFRDALESLPDPVFVFTPHRTPDGGITDLEYRFVNTVALRSLGRPRHEIIGHRLLELFPTLRDSQLWRSYLDVIASGTPDSVHLRWLNETGRRGDFVVNVARFGDGIVVTSRNVTHHVFVEEALRHERDFNNAVLDVAGALILVTDAEGVIIRFNRQAELLTGYREDEVVGTTADFLLPPSERAAVYGNLEPTSPDHLVTQVNHLLTKQGELRMIRWSNTALVDDSGKRTNIISIGIDITNLEQAEADAARQAHELELANRDLARSNADLEQFAYVASHDLAEPLRAISLPITYVLSHYQDRPLDETARQYLQFAVDGSARMQSLIDGLLAFSRVGRVEGAARPVDAGELARQAVDTLMPTIAQSHADVRIGSLPTVVAVPDQLVQVFQNLIGNAVKFVAPGVRPRVTVRAEPVDGAWRIEVIDNGIGIAVKDRERLFTMFKRLNPADRYPGSGIGLAVVKKIVERQGGELGVDSASGGTGSRFWFTLPTEGGAQR